MRKYYFQAVTPEGKQISGYVSAASLDAARDKLKAGGLSILTLEEPKDEQMASGLKVFDFEAMNQMHKKIRGTIEAEDRYGAYKKLRREYELEVYYLIDTTMAPSQKEAQKAAGIEKELEDRLQVEIKLDERRAKKKGKKVEVKHDEVQEAVEANEEERKFMMEKIDSVLSEVIPLLEENSEFIDSGKKREIEERINLLMRLKHSNSVSHLKSLTKRLLTQITSDEIFLQDANIPAELKEEINRRRSKFQAVGTKFDKAISKGLIDLQVQLAKIDTEGLKETVSEIKFFEALVNIFYLTFGFLFLVCGGFLIWNLAQIVFEKDIERSSFFLYSSLIWYMIGLSMIMLISFYFYRFYPGFSWRDRIIVLGSTGLAIFVYSVQFPVIFYWV